ncbi:hypothetical protein CspHIS471_0405240 [Cutaneotrichosporon sp. HIS471]|nr:hypothetical protein CspHIS471_0405240 [Cutaneotrichosporon sp. HIS471]
MSRKIDLSLFRGDDSGDEMDLLPVKRKPVELDPLKSRTFAHGVTKKTKKDLEREDEERKRAEEEAFVPVELSKSSQERLMGRKQVPPPQTFGENGAEGGVRLFELDKPPDPLQQPQISLPITADKFRLPSPPRAPKPRGKRAMDAFLEEIKRPGLTGFVAFMTRKDAAGALARFDGYSLNGNRLRVTWGKPVQLPRRSAYGKLDEPSKVNTRDGPSNHPSHGRSGSPSRAQPNASVSDSKTDYWYDKVPAKELLFLQDVSKRIREHGPGLLDTLKERERENPKFAFLFEKETAAYYVFQHLVNSRFSFPEPPPPSFNEEGYASAYSSDSDEREEMSSYRKAALGKLANRRLEAMLRSMSGKRVEIARAMEFALKRADAYDEVTQIICRSLCVEETPIPRKIARLHLVSDILHNSSSTLPNVWRYRQSFETRLPTVFEHFATIHNRLLEYSGTLSANVFIQQVDAVLDIWERWMVLTSEIQSQLRRLLHGECTLASLAEPQAPVEPELEAIPVVKSAGFKSSFKRVDPSTRAVAPSPVTSVAADLDGEPVEDLDGEPVDDIDGGVDGEPIDVDGEALDDIDGDVDGEDMELDMDEE